MTRKRYATIVAGTILGILAMVVAIGFGGLSASGNCRREGCGWLMLVAVYWFILFWPILFIALLIAFAGLSAFRFRDIGLPGFAGILPATLIPGTVQTFQGIASSPALWLGNAQSALYLLPPVVLALMLYGLFFLRSDALRPLAGTAPYRTLTLASAATLVTNLPSFVFSILMTAPRFVGMWGMRGVLDLLYDLGLSNRWINYARLAGLGVVAFSLIKLVLFQRSRPAIAA